MILTLDRDLDPVAPSGSRSNGVRAARRYAARFDMQGQELAGNVIEWDSFAVRGLEQKRLRVMGYYFHAGEGKLPPPSDFSCDRIVLKIPRRRRCDLRPLGQYLDLRMSHFSGRKAFAERQEELGVAAEPHLSGEQSQG